MPASSQIPNVSEQATNNGPSPQWAEATDTDALPPPRTIVLLGLAFGASAGLISALYLLLF